MPVSERDGDPRWCVKCDRPDRDLGLHAMSKHEPGTQGYYSAMASWSPEPCECDEPEWEAQGAG